VRQSGYPRVAGRAVQAGQPRTLRDPPGKSVLARP
jgi:hypothetical protein